MKALSLYEPWATLIVLGEKQFETRSWSTTYRGPLLICASKKIIPTYLWPNLEKIKKNPISRQILYSRPPQYGRAVCTVDLVDVFRTDHLEVHPDERLYGDFSPGRFAWRLEKVRRFKKPFPVIGRQGLFDIPDNLIEEMI